MLVIIQHLIARIVTDGALGKVLSDDKSVESCEIKEKDFLVLMVSRVSIVGYNMIVQSMTQYISSL